MKHKSSAMEHHIGIQWTSTKDLRVRKDNETVNIEHSVPKSHCMTLMVLRNQKARTLMAEEADKSKSARNESHKTSTLRLGALRNASKRK